MIIFSIKDSFRDFTNAISTVNGDGIGSGVGRNRAWTVSGRGCGTGIQMVPIKNTFIVVFLISFVDFSIDGRISFLVFFLVLIPRRSVQSFNGNLTDFMYRCDWYVPVIFDRPGSKYLGQILDVLMGRIYDVLLKVQKSRGPFWTVED